MEDMFNSATSFNQPLNVYSRGVPGIYAAPDPSAVATSGSGDSSEEEEPSDDEE